MHMVSVAIVDAATYCKSVSTQLEMPQKAAGDNGILDS